MGEPTTPKAPQLPPEAPADLRDFLECKSAKVTLQDGKLTWLPLPPEIKEFVPEGAKPDLSIEPGATPGTATIKVSLGPLSLSLPASISGGQLSVDTSDPGMFTPQKLVDGIKQAVDDINAWFKHNGKGFGKVTFGKGVTLTKVDLAPAPAKTTQAPTPTPVTPTPPKSAPPPAPLPPAPAPIAPGVPGGCLGILFLVLAVVALGAILYFGGPALGLFGVASPTATASPTPTAQVTAAPTASPTPDFRTVRSDDGRAFLFIPFDSAPADAPITLSALGQADAPPELEGVTFRSAFYRIEPTDLTFSGEVGFGRLIDVGEQGLDPDEVGYSVTSLALRTYDGMWSWLGGQSSLIGGTAGTSPETQVQQKGSLMHVGDVFGVGGTVWAHRDPYPEQVDFAVGTTVAFGAKLTGPNGGPFVPGQSAVIARATKYVSTDGIVTSGEPRIGVGSDGSPRVDVTVGCVAAGELQVGVDLNITQSGTPSLLERLGLAAPPEHTVSFRTVMRCVEGPVAVAPQLTSGCVEVVHEPLEGTYPSYLRWLFGFDPASHFPPDPMLQLSYREGTSGSLKRFGDIPITGNTATARTGITMFGDKLWGDVIVAGSDGSTANVAESFVRLFGSSVRVTSAEGSLAGNACP